ncbi:hypothetical protein T459_32290 [Capsicum annuum]|uniref:Uncharacterized protein n=1 Tax=Capsicum annuum TaxID=4072 RepID=A0A2G2Y2E1_CAPAN|nr:hypothetical protein T459_32290 [Capsicum annuum]
MSPGRLRAADSMTLVIKNQETKFNKILKIFTAIDLSRNKFEGEIPKLIGNLNSLPLLNLSHNHLTGHIPIEMRNMSTLEALDLSYNQLAGKIPEELASLTFLEDGEVLAETVPSLQAQEKNDDTTNYIIETAVEDFESTEMDQQANKVFALQKIMMSKKFLVEAGYNLEFLSIDKFSIKKLYLKMLRGISESSMIKKYLQ